MQHNMMIARRSSMDMQAKIIWRVSASLLALCFAATGASAQSASSSRSETDRQAEAQGSTVANDADDPNYGEIVVTASKRGEKLRDVPSAITVLSADNLENLGVRSVRDYASLTPGLTIEDDGTPGSGKVFIRGLNTGTLQQSATTVYYLDDVPFTPSSANGGGAFVAPDPELVDLDRIEVLKGPQGTLYGASSLGGVIRLISKRPDPSGFSGSARAELTTIDSGGTGYSLSTSLNVPLVADQLAVRVTGFYRNAPGFVDNVGTGTKNVNESISKGVRVAIGWTPTERLTVDAVGMIQNINTKGLALEHDVPGTFTPLYGARKYSNFFDAPATVRYRLASLTAKYDVGIGQLIATAAYLKTNLHTESDFTTSYAPLIPLIGLLSGGTYVYPANTGFAYESTIPQKKKTAELRFVSNRLGPVEFIAGGFYTHERVSLPTDILARDMSTNTQLPGPLGIFISAPIEDRYEELSAFGNLTFYLTDNLDVTGGLRYAHYKEDFSLAYSGVYYDTFLGGPRQIPGLNADESNVTYLATVRWRPTRTLSAFLRAASSFRPGGPQPSSAPPPGAQTQINPDTVWNYEAGIKADFLDGKLSLQASAYHIDWKNIQLYTIFANQIVLANAGAAKVDGFEVQAVAQPTDLLTISANVGHTNARISQIDAGVSAYIGAFAGDPIPRTPRWTGSATIDQLIPLGDDLQAQLGATARLQSHTFTSYPSSVTSPNVRLRGISTVDLRAGLRYQRYQFQFRAENVFNRKGVINYNPGGGAVPASASLIRPRSFTLALSTTF